MRNFVQPIRSKKAIENIKARLKGEPRNYLLFVTGLNTAFRVSDLLKLRVKDILTETGGVKSHILIRQQKTGKEVRSKINAPVLEAIKLYRKSNGGLNPEDFLFTNGHKKPLSKVQVWNLIRKWTSMVGLEDGPYGSHTLRKTWGHAAWLAGIDRELIMEKLGHTDYRSLRVYLGITADMVSEVEDKICL